MLPTTLQTNPNPVGDRHPLRIVGSTLETFLKMNYQKHEMSLRGRLQRCGESCFSATALKLTLFPSLGRSSASTLLVLGLAICNLKKTSKNSKGGAQYVAEVRLLTQSSLQASAAYLPLTATTEKFAAIQLAPDSGSRRVNDLKVVFRFLTIFQAINKNIHCDCFKAFTKTIHAMNLFLLPPPQSSIYQGSNIKIPF